MMEHGISLNCEHVLTYLPFSLQAVGVDVPIDHERGDFFQLVVVPTS